VHLVQQTKTSKSTTQKEQEEQYTNETVKLNTFMAAEQYQPKKIILRPTL
jgi:hypothetical protein